MTAPLPKALSEMTVVELSKMRERAFLDQNTGWKIVDAELDRRRRADREAHGCVFVWLTYSDGTWSTRELCKDEATDAQSKGCTVACVSLGVWRAWQAHLDQQATFDSLWSALKES